MDVASLLTLLLLALALAAQPWSVLAAVLLVASEHGVPKTIAYVAGWVCALAAVASAGVAAPLLVLALRGEEAPAIHQKWRAWLVAHGQGLLTVVLAVVAVVLIGKGIVGLVT